jgi:hypothetical protein
MFERAAVGAQTQRGSLRQALVKRLLGVVLTGVSNQLLFPWWQLEAALSKGNRWDRGRWRRSCLRSRQLFDFCNGPSRNEFCWDSELGEDLNLVHGDWGEGVHIVKDEIGLSSIQRVDHFVFARCCVGNWVKQLFGAWFEEGCDSEVGAWTPPKEGTTRPYI